MNKVNPIRYRAGGTGQAGQAKTGPLFLHVMFGIDRYTVMVVNDQWRVQVNKLRYGFIQASKL